MLFPLIKFAVNWLLGKIYPRLPHPKRRDKMADYDEPISDQEKVCFPQNWRLLSLKLHASCVTKCSGHFCGASLAGKVWCLGENCTCVASKNPQEAGLNGTAASVNWSCQTMSWHHQHFFRIPPLSHVNLSWSSSKRLEPTADESVVASASGVKFPIHGTRHYSFRSG